MPNWDTIGLWAGMALPLWDIPLIVRMVQRKSAEDISRSWAWGLWATSICMAPSSFVVGNKIAIAFNIVNVLTLSVVLIVVLKYRRE